MSAHQMLVANLVRTALVLILVGLLYRRRSHLCWSFSVYLLAILTGNSLMSFWPDRFYTRSFYIMKETVYNILLLCVAAELSYRVFRSFPGALAGARRVLAPLIAIVTVGIISVPVGADFLDIVTRYHPQIQTGIVWLLSATAVLTVWYNMPLNFVHRALLLGFSSYLIVFATLANILRSFGFERLREQMGLVEGYAYLALLTWWAITAWRSERAFELVPMRTPLLAAKPA